MEQLSGDCCTLEHLCPGGKAIIITLSGVQGISQLSLLSREAYSDSIILSRDARINIICPGSKQKKIPQGSRSQRVCVKFLTLLWGVYRHLLE